MMWRGPGRCSTQRGADWAVVTWCMGRTMKSKSKNKQTKSRDCWFIYFGRGTSAHSSLLSLYLKLGGPPGEDSTDFGMVPPRYVPSPFTST